LAGSDPSHAHAQTLSPVAGFLPYATVTSLPSQASALLPEIIHRLGFLILGYRLCTTVGRCCDFCKYFFQSAKIGEFGYLGKNTVFIGKDRP
jgi:hypothetical protein